MAVAAAARHDPQYGHAELVHLDSPGDRAAQMLSEKGGPSPEHQTEQQPQRKLLAHADAHRSRGERGMVHNLDLSHCDRLRDPCLLVLDAELVGNLAGIIDPFRQPRVLRFGGGQLLQAPCQTGSQIVDRRDAPVQGGDGALDTRLHRPHQLDSGGRDQFIDARQVRMRGRAVGERVPSRFVLVKLDVQLCHGRADGNPRCRKRNLEGLATAGAVTE